MTPDWRAGGRMIPCQTDPDLWTEKPDGDDARQWGKGPQAHAVALCWTACTMRAACLADAIAEEGTRDVSVRHTIRGGLTPAQRARWSRDVAEGRAEWVMV